MVTSAEGIGWSGHRFDGDTIRMLGERRASGGVALPSINRLIANELHFNPVRAGECGGGRTIGGAFHVDPGIIEGAAFKRRTIVQIVDAGYWLRAGGNP